MDNYAHALNTHEPLTHRNSRIDTGLEACKDDRAMGEIYRNEGWKVQMHVVETEQPHFHVIYAEMEYRFGLRNFSELNTDQVKAPPKFQRMIREWAERNQQALNDAWEAIQLGCIPDKSRFIT